jgi:hypothetical protein
MVCLELWQRLVSCFVGCLPIIGVVFDASNNSLNMASGALSECGVIFSTC